MSANDKLAATFGPGRTTPTPTLETRIAEVVAGHTSNVVYYIDGGGDEGHIACHGCDWQAPSFSGFHEHVAAVLAPVIAEARKDEGHHVIQDIRDTAEHTPDQVGDYGRVELEGYLAIGTREVEAIENGAGFDRMCMSVTDWETGLAEAFKRGFDDAHNQHTAHRERRNLSHPPITYSNPYRSNDE